MNNIYYFFRNIPDGSNFVLYHFSHLFIILTSFILSIYFIKKVNLNRRLELFIGYGLLIQQIVLYLWYIFSKYNIIKEGLPFYHCRIAILSLAFGFIFNINSLKNLGSVWGFIGSVIAIIYPNLDPFSFPHITQFSFFIGHIFLLLGSIYYLFIQKKSFSKKDFNQILIFTNIFHLMMFALNNLLNSNYAYMRKSPIALGSNLNPIVYSLIVIILFNIILKCFFYVFNKIKLNNQIVVEVIL